MARAARDPNELDLQIIDDLERRVRALERRKPTSIRFEAADGAYGEFRVWPGGEVGLKVYNSVGALVHDMTAT